MFKHRAPRLRKLSFSNPRERYPKNFFCLFPARRTQGFFRLPYLDGTPFSRPRVPRLSDSGCSSPAPRRETPRLPTRAGAAQSFSTMQAARDTRIKRQSPSATQTPRFNLPASAHSGVSAFFPIPRDKRHSPPRPSYPVGAGRVFPEGQRPSGRTFRIPFPSSGKVSPARGAQNKHFLIAKNQK